MARNYSTSYLQAILFGTKGRLSLMVVFNIIYNVVEESVLLALMLLCWLAVGRIGRGRQNIDIHLLRFHPEPQWVNQPAVSDSILRLGSVGPITSLDILLIPFLCTGIVVLLPILIPPGKYACAWLQLLLSDFDVTGDDLWLA